MRFTDMMIEDIKSVDANYDFWWKEQEHPFKYMANAIDILNNLKPYEVDIDEEIVERHKGNNWDWDNGVIEQMELLTDCPLSECQHDNTYNWSGNISHDMDFIVCDEEHSIDEMCYVAVHFNRFGDIRGNYTEYALYCFNYFEEFVEAVENAEYEYGGGELIVDGTEWTVTPRIFMEHVEFYNNESGNTEYLYVSSDEEAIEELRKIMKEKVS